MKKWLRRIRGALGMGLTWAAGWGGLGAIIALFGGGVAGVQFGVSVMVLTFGVMGFIGGVAFSVVLGIAGGRRRFDEMSLPRFAGWGAVGGLLTVGLILAGNGGVDSSPLLPVVILGSVVTLLAAGCAAGSLALARRADDRELLEDGADVADIGLTEKETRELLGKT